MGNKLTVKEHYLPRMILKHFSKNKKTLLAYDKKDKISKTFSIYSQCYNNNIYEFIGKYKGVNVNMIENELSKIEDCVDKIIINKILLDKDLSEEEKYIIYIFSTLQLLRTPDSIKAIKDCCTTMLKGTENDNPDFIDRFSKISSLYPAIFPINKDINVFFDWTFQLFMENKDLVIYKSKVPFAINGDCPICNIPNTRFLFFPITPYRCLAFIPKAESPYMEVSNAYVNMLNKSTYLHSKRFTYYFQP